MITSSIFRNKIILEKLVGKLEKIFVILIIKTYQLNKMKNYKPNIVTSSDYASNEMARSSENGGGVFHICDQYEKPICILKVVFVKLKS